MTNATKVFFSFFLALMMICSFLLSSGCSPDEEKKEDIISDNSMAGIALSDFSNAKTGDVVKFGHYEQDNKEENGPEELEWIVLDVKDNSALIITKYAIDGVYYHNRAEKITWETCSLRKWINETFIDAAFSTDEQKFILTTNVSADSNPDYKTDPGNDTEDKVFLLSIDEAIRFFSTDEERKCEKTEYAKTQSFFEYTELPCKWWLRTPGDASVKAALVSSDGSVDAKGNQYSLAPFSFRPAMWISLNH